MSQQPDPTIPFDASVVDEESLRALRAVQRAQPQGDGGSNGTLVGGIATAAMFGVVQGEPQEGGALISAEASLEQPSRAIRPQDEPLRRSELSQFRGMPALPDLPSPDSLASASSQDPSLKAAWRIAGNHGSAGAAPHENTGTSVPEGSPITVDTPPERPVVVVVPPVVRIPDDVPDVTADMPLVRAGDVSGEEDAAIALDLAASLVDRDGSEVLAVAILGVPDGA
ncbi:MAG TPA: hypothetical protein VEY69_05510, partial [Lautropia sp.]|nr:hypothetical protein [Lautropia sp.]